MKIFSHEQSRFVVIYEKINLRLKVAFYETIQKLDRNFYVKLQKNRKRVPKIKIKNI